MIKRYFIGDEKLKSFSRPATANEDGSSSISDAQVKSLSNPLIGAIESSDDKSYTGEIKLPKFDQSNVDKILQNASPDLSNDDYYPEKSVNPIIGQASNKTLGTFPIFSTATIFPAGLWDRRKKALADYMLKLEEAKSSGQQGLNYEFQPQEGSAAWMKAFNENAIEDLHDIEETGRSSGISMRDAGKLGHPLNNSVNSVINNLKSGLKVVSDIEKNISDIETKGLNLDNRIGSKAASAIELYKWLSSQSDNNVFEFGGVKYNGKKELIRSAGFKDAMDELSQDIKVDNDLLSLVENRASQIEKKSQEEARLAGRGEDYIQYMQEKLESKYPLYGKKNPITGEQEMSPDSYINSIALQIAKSRPNLFKEIDPKTGEPFTDGKINSKAEYTLKDIRDALRSNLGYAYDETPFIASGVGGGGGSAASETVNAAPEFVKNSLMKLSRGEVIVGKQNKSTIIPGKFYTTYISNGQLKVVPNGNVVENVKSLAEAGASDGEYGGVDAATAIVQMNSGKNSKEIYNQFNEARKAGEGRVVIDKNGSQQQRFNQAIDAISGSNGIPIAGTGNIWISKMNSRSSDKSDSRFYFTLRDSESNTYTDGVVIPKEKAEASVTNQDAGVWQKLTGNDQVKLFIPKGQTSMIIGGAYYHKNEGGKNSVSSYTIYDKTTGSPLMFPGKTLTDKPYSITVPEYYVKNILSAPEKLLDEANKNYPKNSSSPNEEQMTSVTNTKTKTGGKGTTMTVSKSQQSSQNDESLRVVKFFMKKGLSYEDAVSTEEKYRMSMDAREKDLYAKYKKASANFDISDLKK